MMCCDEGSTLFQIIKNLRMQKYFGLSWKKIVNMKNGFKLNPKPTPFNYRKPIHSPKKLKELNRKDILPLLEL